MDEVATMTGYSRRTVIHMFEYERGVLILIALSPCTRGTIEVSAFREPYTNESSPDWLSAEAIRDGTDRVSVPATQDILAFSGAIESLK